MGVRKHNAAQARKEAKKSIVSARMKGVPTSPRKMRLVADQIRGVDVDKALQILRFSPKEASINLEKLLLSAIANWQAKNEDKSIEEAGLFISKVFVDGGAMLKRIQPRAQGRAFRVRKRSNHVTMILESKNASKQ